MSASQLLLYFLGIVFIAVILEPAARRWHLPFSIVLMAIGFASSELMTSQGFDLGIRWYHINTIAFYFILPVVVFNSAINIEINALLRSLGLILFLAIPLMLVTTALSSVLIYFGINHPSGFPWQAALLTSTILASTDPASVVAFCIRLGAPQELNILLEGESIFNDSVSIVLYTIVMHLTLSAEGAWDLTDVLTRLGIVFSGGLGIGLVTGLIGVALFRLYRYPAAQGVFSILLAYASFVVAETYLQVSGIMAVLILGLFLSFAEKKKSAYAEDRFFNQLWRFLSFIAYTVVFLLVGITITVAMFEQRWLAMLIGIGAALISRAVGIFGLFAGTIKLFRIKRITHIYHKVLFWGGARGAVAAALALSLPLRLDYWFTVQSIVYGVVIFTMATQSFSVFPLIHYSRSSFSEGKSS